MRIGIFWNHERNPKLFPSLLEEALSEFGNVDSVEQAEFLEESMRASLMRGYDVLLTGWGGAPIPAALAEDPGSVRYVCGISGSIRATVPRELIGAGIPVTNWGDTPADGIAEGAMTLLLAVLKELRCHIEEKTQGGWAPSTGHRQGTLSGLRVGLYGLGVIGRRFVELIRPFGPELSAYDPYSPVMPDGLQRIDSLDDLFARSEAVVIHAGLTSETRHSVNAKRLALLPDGGIIINTARGAIIDQTALFAELATGRLRAGLDVLDDDGRDWLPEGHPARLWPNLILTAHRIGGSAWPHNLPGRPARLGKMHEVCIDNLRRFASDQPLRFAFDLERYDRST